MDGVSVHKRRERIDEKAKNYFSRMAEMYAATHHYGRLTMRHCPMCNTLAPEPHDLKSQDEVDEMILEMLPAISAFLSFPDESDLVFKARTPTIKTTEIRLDWSRHNK